ncbi:diguanylate cyclase [bacterium]|nr:diguanylate cyclase [bacterium]
MSQNIIDQKFKVNAEIGKGGMGVVYRVTDLMTDRQLALKTLPSIFRSQNFLQRFKNEFMTIAKLNHPHLIEVFDFGIDEQQIPYFTMEYIEGWSFDLFPHIENLKYFMPLVIQVADALDYIHSRGLVHRDIKPTNILVYCEPTSHRYLVKLTDFGLATSPVGKPSDMPGGTVMYMAPEVLKNERIDFLSDLYSLGVVLYKVLTRSLPFQSSNSGGLIKQQICDRLIEPKELNPDIPDEINWLIMKLLKHNPDERIQSAVEVREFFLDMMTRIREITSVPTLRKELYQSQFIGRSNEFQQLKSAFEALLEHKSASVLIAGETGIGKSRLLKEIKHYIQLKHRLVFQTQITQSPKQTYSPLTQLFEHLVHFISGRHKDMLDDYFPYLETMVPHLQPLVHAKQRTEKHVFDPKSEKIRLQDGLLRFIEAVSQEFQPVVIFDDIHNASADDLQFIELLISRFNRIDMLLILSYNSDLGLERTALQAFLQHLSNQQTIEHIKLERFSELETKDLIRSIVGEKIEDNLLYKAIFAKTEGNPLYVDEYLQLLVNRHALVWERTQWQFSAKKTATIPGPKSIHDILLSKIESLDHVELKLLQYCATYGREFNVKLVQSAAECDRSTLTRLIGQLIQNRTIEPILSKDDYYSFTHGTYQQIIYNDISINLRTKMHLHLAQQLDLLLQQNDAIAAGDIAFHYLNGLNYEKGMIYAFLHARYLLETYANEKAIEYLQEILDYLNRSRSAQLKKTYLLEALSMLRDTYSILGRWQDALLTINKANRCVLCYQDKAIHFFYAANIYFQKGDYRTALRFITLARRTLPPTGVSPLPGRLILLQSLVLEYQGKTELAITQCHEAITIFTKLQDDNLLSKAYNALGKMYDSLGNPSQMIKWFSRSLKLRRKVGDRFGEAACLNNLALAFASMARFDVAVTFCKKSMSLNREIGYLDCLAKNLCNMANFYLNLGDTDKAQENQLQGLAIYQSVREGRGQAIATNNLGRIKQARGEFSEAERYLRASLDLKLKIGDIPLRVKGYIDLGNLMRMLSRTNEAIHCHKTALILARKTDNRLLQTQVYSALAEDYLLLEDIQKVERYLTLSTKTSKNILNKDVVYDRDRLQIQLLLKKADIVNASHVLKKIQLTVQKHSAKSFEGFIERLNGQYFAIKGDLEKMVIHFERAIALFQKTHNAYELANTFKEYGAAIHFHDPEKSKSFLLQAQQIFKNLLLEHDVTEIDRYLTDNDIRGIGRSRIDRDLQILIEASKAMMSIPDLDELLNYLVDKALEVAGAQRAFLVLIDEKFRLQTKVVKHFSQKELDKNERFSSSIIQEVLLQHKPVIIPDAMADERFKEETSIVKFDIRSVIAIPLISPRIHREIGKLTDESTTQLIRDLLGVIYLDSQVSCHVFTEDDLNSVITLANDAAIALENMHLFRLATIDGLTRTYIFRYFQQRLKEELLRASRFGRNLALLMIDIDHFKNYNDRYGHQSGNLVLRTIAYEIRSLLRSTDILCRYGGEEFTLIIPETDCYGAFIVAEKIREHIQNLEINNTHVTVSIGIACFPDHDIQGRGDFIEKSDFALYQAKLSGRNRTIIFSSDDLNNLPMRTESITSN